MSKRKVFYMLVAVILIIAISIVGTLAILKEETSTVTNTFVAAGGGALFTNPTTQFVLDESEASYAAGAYSLDTTTKVTANSYDKLAPNMDVPKDPTVHVALNAGAEAYIFIVVTDASTDVTYTIDSKWSLVSGYTNLYYYNVPSNSILIGTESSGSPVNTDINILTSNHFTTDDPLTATAGAMGTLSFKAFAVQAQGYASPAAAWAGAAFASSGATASAGG